MNEIEELEISELKKKNKKFKFSIKKTILGIVVSLLVISSIPNAEYEIALLGARNGDYIESVMESDKTKEQKICEIFETAINSNDNLDKESKEKIISSFEEEVIIRGGYLFTEDTIYNMYAVAKTERVKEISSFSKEHGWWSGDYISYLNTYTLINDIEDTDSSIIAHEQLHAILKNGFIGSGFYKTIFHGYGINEGATSFLTKKSDYPLLETFVNYLGMILGYDVVLKYYVDGDLSGLKKEINKYLSPSDTNKFIANLDVLVYVDYLESFLEKNSDYEKSNKIISIHNDKLIESQELLTKIFENKHGTKVKDSDFGRLLFDVYYANTSSDNDINNYHYYFTYNDKDSVLLHIYCGNFNGIFTQYIDIPKEQLHDKEEKEKKKIAESIGAESVSICSHYVYEDGIYVGINDIAFKIPIKELEHYDYKSLINHVKEISSPDQKTL